MGSYHDRRPTTLDRLSTIFSLAGGISRSVNNSFYHFFVPAFIAENGFLYHRSFWHSSLITEISFCFTIFRAGNRIPRYLFSLPAISGHSLTICACVCVASQNFNSCSVQFTVESLATPDTITHHMPLIHGTWQAQADCA